MSQRQTVVDIATKEVGYVEGPKDNETKFGKFTKVDFQPWCGSFVMWCMNEAKVKIPNCVSTAAGAEAFKKAGRWKDVSDDYRPQKGDLVFFDFPHDGVDRISHIGIVAKPRQDGVLEVIEGNTTADGKVGSQRNGGEVALKIRAWRKDNSKKLPIFIVGYGLPDYKD